LTRETNRVRSIRVVNVFVFYEIHKFAIYSYLTLQIQGSLVDKYF